MKEHELAGKAALISGGTGGVGLEAGIRLARAGASVTVTGRTPERGEDALARLKAVSDDVHFEAADSGDAGSIGAAVDRAAARSGGALDIVISAGAEGQPGAKPFAEMTPDEIQAAFNSRLYPRLFPVHAAIPALRARGGSIVMLSTDAARHPTPGESVMGAAGAAYILMTKVFAREFARWQIRVNSVAMTLTSGTPSWDRIFSNKNFQQKLFAKAAERFPQGRPPTVDEVADVVAFLVSDEAGQINGQTVSVNGGLSFGGW
ncbi:SDR family NAD(P)-dependent oxidoreductase [Rhodococcus opacus]|uniref:Putative oxidoreductase n=1 Tax=Rhodococcus opacus (strain B4) TaxID=632772 RepID=C1B5L8_RHOOB|nr:SDR family oxidoreductase [Rhodococcus opacus]BAH51144.1 putative oxidoreductase [Rhodococcus opacus B4]